MRSACCAQMTSFRYIGKFERRLLLPKVIRVPENFESPTNHFDCAGAPPFHQGIGQVLTMLTIITGILIVLSIVILIAHAMDAFRSQERD
jgi:hypothetical protein